MINRKNIARMMKELSYLMNVYKHTTLEDKIEMLINILDLSELENRINSKERVILQSWIEAKYRIVL